MSKVKIIRPFSDPISADPRILEIIQQAETENLKLRADDLAFVHELVHGSASDDEDGTEESEAVQSPNSAASSRGPRKLTAKEMPSSKEVADFYAEHPELLPARYEDVPNGVRTEEGFRITEPMRSSFERDSKIDVPEWAGDDMVVFRVLSGLYSDPDKGLLAYEAICARWRGQKPADDSLLKEMSDAAVKQLLYRVRKTGDEVLVQAENGKWYLRKETFKKTIRRLLAKGNHPPQDIIFYVRIALGLKTLIWDWPTPVVIMWLRVLKKKDLRLFEEFMARLCQMRDLAKANADENRPEVIASLFAELEYLDPFKPPLVDLPFR